MKKQQAVLLGESNKELTHKLVLCLQDKHSVEMRFSSEILAKEMRDHFRAVGCIGTLGIRDIKLESLVG
jgi:hypothetical protein